MKINGRTFLVSFCGADGVGKTTQIKRIAEALREVGFRVATVKLPTSETFTGRIVKWMMLKEHAVRLPNVFQAFQWLDKFIFQLYVLPRITKDNDFVLLDRWHATMWAYGLSSGANEWLTNLLVDSLIEPHLVLILCGECKRSAARDVYERNASLQKSVKLHYVLWACTHTQNVRTVSTDDEVEKVTQNVLNVLRNHLGLGI